MHVWLRADASTRFGVGHVMRTLALAEHAKGRGLEVRLIWAGDVDASPLAARFGVEARPAEDGDWIASIDPGDVVWFDGYHFSEADFERARDAGARVAAIDDQPRSTFGIDLLVVPENIPGWTPSSDAKVLMGPDFALVRNEFKERRRIRSSSPDRLLVTFGGSDTKGLGRFVAGQAAELKRFGEIVLLEGPATPRSTDGKFSIIRNPRSVADIFDNASAAISAAGSTTWELLCMGVPTCVLEIAPNQRYLYATVVGADAALGGGRAPLDAAKVRETLSKLGELDGERLSRNAMSIVDGLGPMRVTDAIFDLV
ncbi:MAG: hypothetical protein M3277_09215 [Actinomycetota bacterium]|nr:hypothetical protein [Actinomycetota bacterium]